jgi:hypothetical protein
MHQLSPIRDHWWLVLAGNRAGRSRVARVFYKRFLYLLGLICRKSKKSVDIGLVKSDKASMRLRFTGNTGLKAVARKAASLLHSRLLDVEASLLLVVIILVLLTQSGVGLIA